MFNMYIYLGGTWKANPRLLAESLLEGIIRHNWNSFTAAAWVDGKRCPSTLVCECTFPTFTSLSLRLVF